MRLRLCQFNATVADFAANLAAIEACCERARAAGDTLVLTPELALTGYPPLDLLERDDVLAAADARIDVLARASKGLVLVAGAALPTSHGLPKPHLRPAINAALVFEDGRWVATVCKRLLPTYDVFDEDRYFQPGTSAQVLQLAGKRVGITICEDIWNHDDDGPPRYDVDPVGELVAAGAEVILNLSASPFDLGKAQRRMDLVAGIARKFSIPLAYCNLVGGNDGLLFDGRSLVVDRRGQLLAAGPAFASADVCADLTTQPLTDLPSAFALSAALEARAALVMGLRDYVNKCGFSKVLLGLSGGIDSALTAALAVEALGPDAVLGVAMPGPYSSDHSVQDALALAHNLGIRCPVVPIGAPYDAVLGQLAPELDRARCDKPVNNIGITEQNVQARLRGLTLMALSNETGALLLTTGNKSELAVGYCTLYGDMNGGLAVIGDLPKMLVYAVAQTYNHDTSGQQSTEIIPQRTLDKAPSAELAPNQTDQDSLPPYPDLDDILDRYIIRRQTALEMEADGLDGAVVRRIIRLVELSEYKRRQAAPVLRVTRKAFGGGRRVPLARNLGPW
jgi:NAD+ synthase (glutamine-hydrolysing)